MILMAILMGTGSIWGVFAGIRLWGDYLNNAIVLGPLLGIEEELHDPLTSRISLMIITLVLGACSAALLSRQFRINRPPPLEYLWGAFGGTLMGIRACLAGGFTTGGFFVPLTLSSAAGWAMWVGLLVGAVVGLKLLLWTMEHITWGTTPPKVRPARLKRWYPWIGLVVIAGVLAWTLLWWDSDDDLLYARALLVIVGFAIGFVLHRSHFCCRGCFANPL